MVNGDSIKSVLQRINSAAIEAKRDVSDISLMGVSKTQPQEAVQKAMALGIRLFGENRVIEAINKFEGISKPYELHLIGQLQSNKVNKAVGFFSVIESVDSVMLAKKISNRAATLGIVQKIFIQQNCSFEESKSGFSSSDELFKGIDEIRKFPNICINGLMTIGPTSNDIVKTQKAFSLLRENFSILKEKEGLDSLKHLSMGMSNDLEIAIKEGATIVRVGTALFGGRDYNGNNNGI